MSKANKKKMTPAQKAAARWDAEGEAPETAAASQSAEQGGNDTQAGAGAGSDAGRPPLWGIVLALVLIVAVAAYSYLAGGAMG